jgi:hypothetical protein
MLLLVLFILLFNTYATPACLTLHMLLLMLLSLLFTLSEWSLLLPCILPTPEIGAYRSSYRCHEVQARHQIIIKYGPIAPEIGAI